MSWPVGTCEGCNERCDYRFSWGYEKSHGLDDCDGKLLCGECRRKKFLDDNSIKQEGGKNED
jgi:hypothetical protein